MRKNQFNLRNHLFLVCGLSSVILINIYPVIFFITYKSYDSLFLFNLGGIILSLLVINLLKTRKIFLEARKSDMENFRIYRNDLLITGGVYLLLTIIFGILSLI